MFKEIKPLQARILSKLKSTEANCVKQSHISAPEVLNPGEEVGMSLRHQTERTMKFSGDVLSTSLSYRG